MKTFPAGGIHPPENKLTADKPIAVLPIPETVVIPVAQHIGAPTEVLVKKGDIVKTGQLISKAGGFVSANIFSSVSGKVNKIDTVMSSGGVKQNAIIIDVDGDEWMPDIDRTPNLVTEIPYSAAEIVRKISEAGIVGMGGATFPTHVKLTIPKGKRCEILIINAVECEPFLTSDHRLMLEHGEEVMVGIQILMKALDVSVAKVGIESNKPDAIELMQKLSLKFGGIEVCPLKVKYPQGAEKQLIKALIDREVPMGGLPIDVGAVVQNVGTAFAVYEAVQKNKPLFERVVTVTGRSLSNPGNYMVRMGCSFRNLIDAAGGLPENTGKVIAGGPMMGKAIPTIDVPIVKGTSGVVVMDSEEAYRAEVKPCVRCAKCISACPLQLEPYLLARLSELGKFEEAGAEGVANCCECASCHFSCPSNRPLIDYIRLGKSTVIQMARKNAAKK